jgi:elongation factor P--(R)-beta-lysine ligase
VADWQPSASIAVLKKRAELLHSVRFFFAQRQVWEVDTPILSAHATVDRHIDSFVTTNGRWLQTSPEFAMKRLLCAGSGPIYQIAHAFRREESGRFHHNEFSLLEWYRPGFDHYQLMDEVEALLRAVGVAVPAGQAMERLSYRQVFIHYLAVDPLMATGVEMREAIRAAGCDIEGLTLSNDATDAWLDVAMSLVIGPKLGADAPCFLYDFPASQAALARIRPGASPDAPPVAERFEVFWRGVELANGFHELGDASEQERRFVADHAWRTAHGRDVPPFDRHLIDALEAGLPDCAGVAIGLDRLLMLRENLPSLSCVCAFHDGNA